MNNFEIGSPVIIKVLWGVSRVKGKIVDKILLTTPNYTKEYSYLVQFEDNGIPKILRRTEDQIELDIAAIRQEKLKLILN